MSGRRTTLEKQTQREIEAAIGAEPDLLLMRNSVGTAKYYDDNGRMFVVPYGVGGKGAPDLVGMYRATVAGVTVAIWIAFEVKAAEGALEADQVRSHAIWKSFGALVFTVRSAKEARLALESVRSLFRKAAA